MFMFIDKDKHVQLLTAIDFYPLEFLVIPIYAACMNKIQVNLNYTIWCKILKDVALLMASISVNIS